MQALTFSAPWVLSALIALPVIWFLLRLTPPLPKRVKFPPLLLLNGLKDAEQTPAGTPWWVLVLRLLLAAAVIVALAGPQIGTPVQLQGRGPLVLVIDNGWTAAAGWQARQAEAMDAIRQAGTRPVVVIQTTGHPDISLLDKGAAMHKVDAMEPRPWQVSRKRALDALNTLDLRGAEVLWLSDDIEDGLSADFARVLRRAHSVRLYTDPPGHTPLAILQVVSAAGGFTVTLVRAGTRGPRQGTVIAFGRQGQRLASAKFAFADGSGRTEVSLNMPLQMRNKTGRLEIAGQASAGAVMLFDRGTPRRSVGIVMESGADEPLLSGAYYLKRALGPYADILSGSVQDLVTRHVSVLILPGGRLMGERHDRVAKFVEKGGVLIRFADDKQAEGSDDLTPVPLRSGGRYFGGAMAWMAPQHIASFPDTGPFGGLSVPADVTVSRQILAEPSVNLAQHSWARLTDGTPMVTAAERGKGWIVQFHVTAGPDWSSLPLSGLYVEMLRRLLPLAGGASPADLSSDRVLPPYRMLDGFGRLQASAGTAEPVRGGQLGLTEASERHPAGLYGAPDHARALNAATPRTALLHLPSAHRLRLSGHFYGTKTRMDLSGPLMIFAALLLMTDFLVSLSMRGLTQLRPGRFVPVLAAFLAAGMLFPPGHAAGMSKDEKAALDTRLAYVITGVSATDAMSRAGLTGLDQALTMRTSYEPQAPIGVNLETDDLSFYPLIYWPMDPGEKDLSPAALAKLADYMRLGGTLLIDTRDLTLGSRRGPDNPGQKTLRRLLSGLDLPPLGPVPAGHALARAFYLLGSFPGRWDGGTLWVERPGATGGDQVSPLIIGSNDWAAAWAVDRNGRYMADVSPGGERQRELAYRFGINVVMYALTGNYKTDQIHVSAILKRLGK